MGVAPGGGEKKYFQIQDPPPPTQREGNCGAKNVKLPYFLKKTSFLLPGIDQTNQGCSNDDQEGSTKIINIMIPRTGVLLLGGGHISHILKMHYFFNKSFSLLSQALIRQTKYIVMMNKKRCTKIVNFLCHYSEYVLSSCLLI